MSSLVYDLNNYIHNKYENLSRIYVKVPLSLNHYRALKYIPYIISFLAFSLLSSFIITYCVKATAILGLFQLVTFFLSLVLIIFYIIAKENRESIEINNGKIYNSSFLIRRIESGVPIQFILSEIDKAIDYQIHTSKQEKLYIEQAISEIKNRDKDHLKTKLKSLQSDLVNVKKELKSFGISEL